tara:strand:+ start:116 stop:652 length:537 start_codon:yes stop_codon:yes gene_type:complete
MLKKRMLIDKLLSFVDLENFDSVPITDIKDESLIKEFEKDVLYRDCFSKSANLDLWNLSKSSKVGLMAVKNNKCIGCIFALYSDTVGFVKYIPKTELIIVNFCVDSDFRSDGVGSLLMNTLLSRVKFMNSKIFLGLSKKEPLNNICRLERFYNKFGFVRHHEDENYIIMKKKMSGEFL